MLPRVLKNLSYCLLIILASGQFAMASNGQPATDQVIPNFGSPGSLTDGLGQSTDFLPVEQAFQMGTWVAADAASGKQTLFINWQITPGYYLYRHRFAVKQADSNTSADVIIPAGKAKNDPYFGDVEVYYQQATLTLPLEGINTDQIFKVSYQGCADAGLCYPPQTVYLERHNQTATLSSSAAQTVAPSASIKEAIPTNSFTQILSSAGLPSIIGLFFLAGLALTFTPCVLPMIPIVSSIVLGQADKPSRLRAFSLSLTYVLAMAATYALAGMLTGYFGASLNLQLQLQSPWIIITIALLFVAFALSMLGFYELRLPSAWQSKLQQVSHNQRGGTYIGVALIGIISTLIVSPCITAPLAGTLVFISSTGDPTLGGIALLALGLGMGLPLLLIGTFGAQLLPKSGQWMNRIKVFFGILLLGLAIWMLERVLPPAVALTLWLALLLGYALNLGLLKLLRGQFSALPLCGLALALFSMLLVFNASQGHFNPFTPLKTFEAERLELEFHAVDNLAQLELLLAEQNQGRVAMLDLYADWCVSCQILEQEIFPSPAVSQQLQQLVLIRADITTGSAEHQALLKHFGLFGPPSLLFFTGEQELRAQRIQGEISTQALAQHLVALAQKTVKETDSSNSEKRAL